MKAALVVLCLALLTAFAAGITQRTAVDNAVADASDEAVELGSFAADELEFNDAESDADAEADEAEDEGEDEADEEGEEEADTEGEDMAFVETDAEETEAEADEGEAEADTESEAEAEGEAESETEGETEAEAEGESEAETETESESDAAAEESSEAEAEAESETASEAELMAAFDLGLRINSEAGADSQWHVYSNMLTEQAHEGLSAAALKALPPNLAAVFNADRLRVGTIWNDMPSGSSINIVQMVKDGHMDVDTWTRAFFRKADKAFNELVYNVHYGCLQHWHSMCPIMRTEWNLKAGRRTVFTNAQVKNFIIDAIRYWWRRARQHTSNIDVLSFYVGHILHTVQDSYPRGHVVRDTTNGGCGGVITFEGYDSQHGNEGHKIADFSPAKTSKKEKDPTLTARHNCARDASIRVLTEMAQCVLSRGTRFTPLKSMDDETNEPDECNFSTQLYDFLDQNVYNWADTAAPARTAGGTRAEFAAAEVPASGEFVQEKLKSADGREIVLWNPASTNIWDGRAQICAGNGAIQSEIKNPTGLTYSAGSFTDNVLI